MHSRTGAHIIWFGGAGTLNIVDCVVLKLDGDQYA